MNSSEKLRLLQTLKIWARLARIPFLTATIVPVALGTIVAWTLLGNLNLGYFVMTLVGALCLHLGTNIINDYFDFRSGCDAINTDGLSPISGGSRVLLEGLIKPQRAYFVALSFFGVASIIGIILSIAVGWGVFLLGIVGIVSGYFYVSQLSTRGIGELIVGLNFGPLMVLGSYYVQTQRFDSGPLVASVPIGLLITAILWINEVPDYAADKAVGKKTLVVRVGRKRAAELYALIVIAAYVWTALMAVLKQLPFGSLLVLITLPIAAKAIIVAMKYHEKPRIMVAANLSTIKIHLLFGVLLTASYVAGLFWSYPY